MIPRPRTPADLDGALCAQVGGDVFYPESREKSDWGERYKIDCPFHCPSRPGGHAEGCPIHCGCYDD